MARTRLPAAARRANREAAERRRAEAEFRLQLLRRVEHMVNVRVIAASLHRQPPATRHAAPDSNEPAGSGNPAGSTTTTVRAV